MRLLSHTLIRPFVLLVPLVLVACSEGPRGEQIGKVEDLYNQGMNAVENKAYLDAIHTFEELERQHPYSGWATRAQMMVAYAHYRREAYDEVVIAADRFVRMHPGHKDLPYLYYLKGLSYYEQISDVKRDQGFTLQALDVFEELRRRFPDSEYAQDALLKITLCRDHLAGQEMMVGRFYEEQGRFLAAINRFRYVVETYETTSQTPEALYRLSESYLALGVDDEAQAAAAVLGHNFPESRWYEKAYNLLKGKNLEPKKSDDSWLIKLFKGA